MDDSVHIPLNFWFNNSSRQLFSQINLSYIDLSQIDLSQIDFNIKHIEKDEMHFNICECSDYSVREILLDKNKELKQNHLNPYKCGLLELINVINSKYMYLKKFEFCNKYVLEDIKLCIYYFQIQKELRDNKLLDSMKNSTLWSFICGYLTYNKKRGYTENSGYDYLLMNILDAYGVINHGSGIRCGWLIDNKNFDVNSEPTIKEDIMNWLNGKCFKL